MSASPDENASARGAMFVPGVKSALRQMAHISPVCKTVRCCAAISSQLAFTFHSYTAGFSPSNSPIDTMRPDRSR